MWEPDYAKVTSPVPKVVGDLRLALVGTGALGSALARNLACAGVRHVLLIDPGHIERRNLPLSPFLSQALRNAAEETEFSEDAIFAPGVNKAELLAAEARRAYNVPWRALPVPIADAGWQDLENCDLICSCTDSALSRMETAYAARMLGKPVLDGGVLGHGLPEGRSTFFASAPEAACYLCGLSATRSAHLLAYAASASLGCQAVENAAENTAHLETIECTAAILMQEVKRYSSGLQPEHSIAKRLAWTPDHGAGPAIESVYLTRGQTCPWHPPQHGRLVDLPLDAPIQELLQRQSPGTVLQLAWPICTVARCRDCKFRAERLTRVAQIRADTCPGCGGRGTLEPLSAVSTIRQVLSVAEPASITQNGQAASYTLRQLRQPERHLYLLRTAFQSGSRWKGQEDT